MKSRAEREVFSGCQCGGLLSTDDRPLITVEISNEQSHLPPQDGRLRKAVRIVLEGESVAHARVSLAVVDDATIRRLHREYLEVDQPTDVLSFLFQPSDDGLEGEVIVSAETAKLAAARFGWPAEDELLLYVIHGTLHLAGYRDATAEQQARMRRQERVCLSHFGLDPPYEESDVQGDGLVGGKKEVS